MTTFVFANNVNTTLASPVATGSATITLASSANLPTIPSGDVMALTLNDAATRLNYEIVYVTNISGSTLTVERAQEGTTALSWSTGDYAFSGPTAGQMDNFEQGAASGVTPGTYGSTTVVGQFTVNANGIITAAQNDTIAFPIPSFNGRSGAITLNSGDVTIALGYTPVNKAGDTMTGALNAPSIGTASIGPESGGTQGLQIEWNTVNGGDGRNEYVNNYGTGSGGHYFYSRSLTTNSVSLDFSSDALGNMVAASLSSSSANMSIANNGSSGAIFFRPNGLTISVGQTTIFSSGNMTVSGTVTGTAGYFNNSDESLKDNINSFDPRPLHRNIKMYSWSWKRDNKPGIGSIAQHVKSIEPLYVEENEGILSIEKAAIALEQSMWSGIKIDEIIARLESIEKKLAGG